jgi:ABC-type multidrug transport system fused ATPase/permease subunit
MRAAQRRGSVIAASPRIVIELVFFGAAVLLLVAAAPRIGDPSVLSGAALGVVAAMRLLPAFSGAAGTWVQVHQAFPAVRRISTELDRLEARLADTATGGHRAVFERDLECRGVRFAYADRPPALRGVDLRIEAGSFVAIVGPSGSGKSTLIDLLCGLHDPDDGQILIDGHDLRRTAQAEWRALLGVVPQDGFLLSGTLRENLCLLRPDCPEPALRQALTVTGADAVVAELPDGLNTIVGERGVALSGGQRQRLALARVLLREPRILILDEATSALDQQADEMVFRQLARQRGEMTIVAIAHRLSSIRGADHIFVMRDGAIVEDGTHDALVRANGVYSALWRAAQQEQTADMPIDAVTRVSHG